MPDEREISPDVMALIHAACEGTLDDERAMELAKALEQCVEARRLYVEYLQLDSGMTEHCQRQRAFQDALGMIERERRNSAARSPVLGFLSGSTQQAARFAARHKASPWVIGAIVAPIAMFGLFWMVSRGLLPFGGPPDPSGRVNFVAQLSGAYQVVWSDPESAPLELAHLRSGQRLELNSGLAEITFRHGAKVVLQGPAEFQIESGSAGTLDVGALTANVPEQAVGFVVHSHAATITDLGTEFGIHAAGQGEHAEVDVHVFAGAVELAMKDPDGKPAQTQKLRAGESAIIRPGEKKIVKRPARPERFIRSLTGPKTTLAANQDAYVENGAQTKKNFGREPLLLVKRDVNSEVYNRKVWLGFHLAHVDRDRLVGARLLLSFIPAGPGEQKQAARFWDFEVYGLPGAPGSDWSENTITWDDAPKRVTATPLAEFRVSGRGDSRTPVPVSSRKLVEYLRSQSGPQITLIVVRRTVSGPTDGHLRHVIASREHPALPPPTLELTFDPAPPAAAGTKPASKDEQATEPNSTD